MSNVAIRVNGLGKKYQLGKSSTSSGHTYATLRDLFQKWTSLRNLLRKDHWAKSNAPFWALKGVTFEVEQGEVIGIIGRNGAGKSTLLKILSQITEPTEGWADIYGRVGSLLEVGTGFNPELTGRENIYLNGAILGMRRAEITQKFHDIVDFAEVERFIDTPVKYFSSGMYTRLAFAVAAHLEPEILVVDEVLDVGDAEFKKKCLGKMGEAAKGGRTVLFVSHNMAAIRQFCHTVLLLSQGEVVFYGEINACADLYGSKGAKPGQRIVDHTTKRSEAVTIDRLTVDGNESDEAYLTDGRRGLLIEMAGIVHRAIHGSLQVRLHRQSGHSDRDL